MKPGDAVKYAEPGGSIGLIVAVTGYDPETFYVRWCYGVDIHGNPWKELSAVRSYLLKPIPREAYDEHSKARMFSVEQKEILTRYGL